MLKFLKDILKQDSAEHTSLPTSFEVSIEVNFPQSRIFFIDKIAFLKTIIFSKCQALAKLSP